MSRGSPGSSARFHRHPDRATMHTRAVTDGLAFVALTTLDGFGGEVVVGMFVGEIAVATDARIGAMRGVGQLGLIHKEENLFSGSVGLRQGFVRVTIQTITVLQPREGSERQNQSQCRQATNSFLQTRIPP